MRRRFPTTLAIFLTACGGAGVATNNVVGSEANAQRGSGNNQQYDSRAGIDDAIAAHGYTNNGGIPGCFDPALSGRARAVAERGGAVPCESSGKSDASARNASVSGFDGYWAGDFDGSAGEAIIARGAGGRYGVQLSVSNREGCAGEIQGQASVQGGRLVLVDRIPNGGGICRVTMTRRGATLTVEEDNCAFHHGLSCGFSGTLRFRESNEGLEPPADHSE